MNDRKEVMARSGDDGVGRKGAGAPNGDEGNVESKEEQCARQQLRKIRARLKVALPAEVLRFYGLPGGQNLKAFSARAGAALLAKCGVRVSGNLDAGTIILDPELQTAGSEIEVILGGAGHILLIGGLMKCKSRVKMRGDGNIVVLAGQLAAGRCDVDITCEGSGTMVFLGRGTSARGLACIASGRNQHIAIGAGCLIARNVWIRNSDRHTIFDIETLKPINVNRSVTVGPRVWLAQGAVVLKGATIGSGSIIGGGALVSRPIPPRSLAVGSPARPVRHNVCWNRTEAVDDTPVVAPTGWLAEVLESSL